MLSQLSHIGTPSITAGNKITNFIQKNNRKFASLTVGGRVPDPVKSIFIGSIINRPAVVKLHTT